MNELKKLFLEKITENGDLSYLSTGNKLIDILFMTQYFRNNLNKLHIGNSIKEKIFAMFIRDPRLGVGERDIGRILLAQTNATPENVVLCGRADDLIYIYLETKNEIYLDYFITLLKNGDYNAKKWSPRLTSGKESKKLAKILMQKIKISESQYRKLIKCDTTEYRVCNNLKIDDYSKISSLSFLKHKNTFYKQDEERFKEFMKRVNDGIEKINTAVSTPYDIFKKCINKTNDTIDKDADILFKSLKQVNLGSILPIIDNSGSMYDEADSQGKAKAIGHYVAKNSTYLPNHVITFSSKPRLLELGNTYEEDMRILNSYHDFSSTDFGKVMELLSKLDKDVPDYLLVLSDMEFDEGSNTSKNKTMKLFKEKGIKTKIIWWNFNTRNTTCPELDEDGNIFLSGYNPQLLKFLEVGFNSQEFLNKLLNEYINNIFK